MAGQGGRKSRMPMTVAVRAGTVVLPLAKGTVQVGTTPGHSFTISNLSAADEEWLNSLFAPKRPTDKQSGPGQGGAGQGGAAKGGGSLGTNSGSRPLSGQRERIVSLLRDHDLLAAPQAAAPLRDLRVRLVGLDRVGVPLARLLSASKVRYLDLRDNRPVDGEVEYLFPAETKGRSRREAVQAEMRGPDTFLSRHADPHLVISVENRVISHQRAGLLLSHEISQLPILVDDRSIQVGPFSIPATTACYLCQDFHHTDQVPNWPHHREVLRRSPAPLPSPALATTAAALAVQQIEAIMSPANPRATVARGAGTWYHGLAWRVYEGGVEELRWLPHPRCNCQTIR